MEQVFEIYIKTTPERLWEAITSSEMRQKYTFGVGISSDWKAGSSYEAVHPGAGIRISEGENLEVDPPRRLVQSFTALWSNELYGGWPMILSGLKTLLETGETLTTPGSLRYSEGAEFGQAEAGKS